MKKQALFVTEKWCDANPSLALTNNFRNLFGSFAHSCPNFTYNTLHLDESAIIYQKHINDILPNYCKKFKTDIIIYSLLGVSPANPSIETFNRIKNMGIYQCIMWPDSASWAINRIKQIGNSVDINILWDNPVSPYHDLMLPLPITKCMWVPQDNSIFFDDNKIKDIDVSFIGSDRYPDRREYISILQKTIKSFVFRGGQREENLSEFEYADLIKRSKISINFSGNPEGFSQSKGRVFEILACNSLLMESANLSTKKILNNDEYVEFSSIDDLIEKIKYYLNNDDKRIEIARKGFDRYNRDYCSKTFWHSILKEANI